MLKGRGRDSRQITSPAPAQFAQRVQMQTQPAPRPPAIVPSSSKLTLRTPIGQRAPIAKPEPDYEVVEFPSQQYVNAKLQPPPPTPPRPPTGHPAEAGASCGLCGGGGARVRCAECGRRALCASCDDMYHRHPKRRHHQRQALTMSQMRDERPPLPPKVAPPVPPPRRHKMSGDRTSASPRPPSGDQRSATLTPQTMMQQNSVFHATNHMSTRPVPVNHGLPMPPHLQGKLGPAPPQHLGSMPYLPNMHVAPMAQQQTNTLGHLGPGWGRPRTSLPGFNMPPNVQMAVEGWDGPEMGGPGWGRPLRRGASVLELGGAGPAVGAPCGCNGWRYGSCASLDHQQWGWQQPCCNHGPPPHVHAPYTPQPYRRADSRALSRAQSRTCSRAASPAMSTRSRTSRRARHRTPSPPPLPSSDADSESEDDDQRRINPYPEKPQQKRNVLAEPVPEPEPETNADDSLGPVPPPPTTSWQCEHCTFVNEPGVRVCVICCRTPTAAPKIIENSKQLKTRNSTEATRSENARSIAASERAVAETARTIAHLDINDNVSNSLTSPARSNGQAPVHIQNGTAVTKIKSNFKKERTSTGCGPSPPREQTIQNEKKQPLTRLVTPTREQSTNAVRTHTDMGVGCSPPKEIQNRSDPIVRSSPPTDNARKDTTVRHSVSVGPSPPRDHTSPSFTVQKKSTGTSPPRNNIAENRTSSASTRTNVSNTGTSPPPQSISTQTYEVPSTYERPASQTRSRRRFRDEARRERSRSRQSLSSDTRESERTSGGGGGPVGDRGTPGGGRWEWRWGRDSSPGGEWSGSEQRPRLARRASHLDLRRTRAPPRRASYYGSEAASPEPTRAASLEALAGVGAGAAAERGMELARLMAAAEQLGFSAAEVQAALAQSPGGPLRWLRERWAGLCAGVVAAAARLEPRAQVSQRDARAALAKHRGQMWPAVTECVDRYRRQVVGGAAGGAGVSGAGRLSGRVWGSPAGAEDDAAPPRRAEGSSDDDDWMYLPLDETPKSARETDRYWDPWDLPPVPDARTDLSRLLPPARDLSLFDTLLSHDISAFDAFDGIGRPAIDLIKSENDFIEAYNALTRSTPLPGVDPHQDRATETGPKRDMYDVIDNDSRSFINNTAETRTNKNFKTDITPSGFQSITDNQTLNNTAPEAFDTDSTNIKDKQPLPTVDANLTQITKTEGITNHSTHSIDVSSKVPAQNDQVTPGTSLEELDSNHTNGNLLGVQTSTPTIKNSNNAVENNNSKGINVRQEDEKLNNLNDIVDTTQKLIQKMKEEINSDINSIDSRNISQSEADSSSNESSDISTERESSFSESGDDESDNSSSNDKESDDETEDMQPLNNHDSRIQRTSSEENDQFEEAMDHIEEQINDFKHTNIELLDSIARSLQEEHTLSVEISAPKNINNVKREDHNNNLFIKVKSFDEIYDDLSDQNKDYDEQDRGRNNNIHSLGNAINNYDHTDNAHEIISVPVSNHDHENDNAHISSYEHETDDNETDNDHETEKDYESENEIDNGPNSIDNSEPILPNKDIDTLTPTIKTVFPKHYIVLSTFQAFPTKLLISNNVISKYNGILETIEDNLNLTDNALAANNTQTSNTLGTKEDNTTTLVLNTEPNLPGLNSVNDTSNDLENEADTTELDNLKITEEITTENNPENEVDVNNQNNSKESLNINEDIILENSAENKVDTNNENNSRESFNINELDHSDNGTVIVPENEQITPNADSNISRISNSLKSNIPKLIKFVQGNKQKADKLSPKIVASKVPIRKASLKQYSAPAPPKSHFGNIQSGHVKQLQTRLFNNKFPKTAINVPTNIEAEPVQEKPMEQKPVQVKPVEVKPSTSTLNKKKPAPPPPVNQTKQTSPVKIMAPKEKKANYFRESCRTEDEWTDSDSEDSQIQVVKADDEPGRAPSPAPPITLRRVSGQFIDLAKVQLPEGSPEGATETWEQARLAVELAARGAAPSAALLAALECADLPAALAYLHQDCELCASRLPEHEMVSMLRCTHRCCRECARLYFTVQINERSIADCVCPYCKQPDLEDLPEDNWLEYFAHLDILLKTLLETDVHELFQRKLRDRTLARDPNFRWCMRCSSGFFVHPKQKRVRCPECRSQSCAKCRKSWDNHEGLSCEQYAAWLEDNDPERSVAAVQQHLRDNGLECPRCHFKYSLSRGGCMHFTCTQCKFEFCFGCGKPFMMGARCGLSDYCAKLGLHAHHPRNCLFYLRDKEPHQLQTLLQMNDVSFETEAPEGSSSRCPVQLQRETPTGLVDGVCGGDVPPSHAGLCKPHYVEYLAGRARALDPLPVMDLPDLVAELRRRALPLPERGPWDSDPIYAAMCAEIVKEKIPLD